MAKLKVKVIDPKHELDEIYLVHSSADMVVLCLNLARKHQEVHHWINDEKGTTIYLDEASIKISNMPFKCPIGFANTNRYTCFVVFLSSEQETGALARMETLWTSPTL